MIYAEQSWFKSLNICGDHNCISYDDDDDKVCMNGEMKERYSYICWYQTENVHFFFEYKKHEIHKR